MCKSCRKDRGHSKRKRYKNGYYTVYYLPEHHYVGMTNALKNRLQEHRSKNGRITEGYEIIGTYERAVDAHLAETILHSIGYYGFYYKGNKKKKMAYLDNKEHKKIIDCVLEQNAKLFQNLGKDCSKAEYEKAKLEERRKLRRIMDLDPEKIGRLIKDSLDD